MSREAAAACPLAAGQLPLLILHRHLPERSLPELIAAAGQVGHPARLAFIHFADCRTCAPQVLVGAGQLCRRGARLIEPARGWRTRA